MFATGAFIMPSGSLRPAHHDAPSMLAGLTWLLVFQCLGEALVYLTGLPVPGPVVGMLLLFVGLRVRGTIPLALSTAATGLLQHLSLLFVPAGVGVMLHFGRVADEWPAIVAAIVASTVLAIAVTAIVMRALVRRQPAAAALAGGPAAPPPGGGEESR
jgi:holin-like protein